MSARIVDTAVVDSSASVRDASSIGHLSQIHEEASIGTNCTVDRCAYIGAGMSGVDKCKVQNDALVYEPARLERGALIGPAVVLTNDQYPRLITPDHTAKSAAHWDAVVLTIPLGPSTGARSVCATPLDNSAWAVDAVDAAGSVVTRDGPDHALVAGVPARPIEWVGRAGRRLKQTGPDEFTCPDTEERFVGSGGRLQSVEETTH